MKKKILLLTTISILIITGLRTMAQNFSSGPYFFPIAVSLQAPYNIQAYKNAGINIYYGLSWGPLDAYHLNLLHSSQMYMMCAQDSFALTQMNDTLIYAWMIPTDEPDNAQWNSNTNQYDSCVNPNVIISQYNTYKATDSTRPVAMTLGQGVANLSWIGRGPCYNWIASYPTYNNGYLNGCDICAFDIYPVNSTVSGITDSLWYVAKGMDSLHAWSPNTQKPMWAWIETTKISSTSAGKPTPSQVISEVWMALIHGAKGIGYFTHSWDPTYISGAVLLDTAMVLALTALNDQIRTLAPVLNSPNISGYATVNSSNSAVPIDIMTKNTAGFNYIFSVAMRSGNTNGTFSVSSGINAEVIGENRTIPISGGQFTDSFQAYGVHLYKIPAPSGLPEEVLETDSKIKCYPNPASNKITIDASRKSEIEIINLQGQIIKRIKTSEEQTTCDISDFARGLYFIKVKTDKGITIRKLIKE